MKATLKTLLEVVGQPGVTYETPIFQRVYSWTERQCADLFADIMTSGGSETEHFMGSMLYGLDADDEGNAANATDELACGGLAEDALAGTVRRYNLIDGQQRAVTITLLLAALRDRLRADDLTLTDGADSTLTSAEAIERTYLVTADGTPKLRISNADAATLAEVIAPGEATQSEAADAVDADDAAEDLSQLIIDNERYFADQIATLSAESMPTLLAGLGRLVVVAAELEPDDQPQLVFETLNSRGMSLSTTDLIRNLLLSHYDYDEQSKLFERYWQPVQALFADDDERLYEDAAVYAWLKEQAPDLKIGARSELYQAFKSYVLGLESLDIEALLRSLSEFCLDFMEHQGTPQVKEAVDWALGRLQGLVSERKLFGD